MVKQIDLRGYAHLENTHHSNYFEFVGIVPIYSDWGRGQGDRPINHLKLTGYGVSTYDFHYCELAPWHPENPFSDEKFIEVYLHDCQPKFEQDIDGEKKKVEYRRRIGWLGDDDFATTRFFVPAHQLRPLHYTQLSVYRSLDRYRADYGITDEVSLIA